MSKDAKGRGDAYGGTGAALVGVTLIGASAGGFLGATMLPMSGPTPIEQRAGEGPAESVGHDSHSERAPRAATPEQSQSLVVKELTPIVVNLASPEKSWIRLQAAIVFDSKELPHPDPLIADLLGDVTAFLKTLTLAELEGPDGLRHLQEDLEARASVRMARRLKGFVIESLVVQ